MSRFTGKGTSWVARAFALAAFVVLTVVAASPAAAAPQNVLRATLSNGLRVVIVRNTLAPVVATSVNYLVGSDESPKGFPGTAHALEHMMFRGSPGLSVDQLANIGSVMGADFNANTGESVTQYRKVYVGAGEYTVADFTRPPEPASYRAPAGPVNQNETFPAQPQ